MNIYLADTSIRMYRRRDGAVSLRLRSYLMIETQTTFSLSAYLRSISGSVTTSDGQYVALEEISFSCDSIYKCGVMVHDLWASGVMESGPLRDDVARLRLDYRISFTGHDEVEPNHFEALVPLVRRNTPEDRVWWEHWHAQQQDKRQATNKRWV